MPSEPGPPPVIWMRPEQPGRGPKPAYSRAEITAAAIRIADAEGLDAVSMRRIAQQIGAGAMSLYRYVPHKSDLLELMIDAVAGEYPASGMPSGDWRADLTALARGQRAAVLRHPWLIELAPHSGMGPNTLRMIEATFSAVSVLGLGIDTMMEIVGQVTAYVTGYVHEELTDDKARRRSGLDREQWFRRQQPYVQKLIDSGDYPMLTRIVMDAKLPHMDPDARFDRGLSRLLDGIAANLPAHAAGGGQDAGSDEITTARQGN
jgi:AcrR family transcriptional regulator